MLQAFSTAFAETTYAAPLESHDAPMLHTRPTSFTWARPIWRDLDQAGRPTDIEPRPPCPPVVEDPGPGPLAVDGLTLRAIPTPM